MATTAKGTPYVESSDLVADYPSVSLALAEHIDDFGGKVLQVVRATDTTSRTTTSTSYVDVTGMSVTITPQKNTSVIIIAAVFAGEVYGSQDSQEANFRITDSSNNAISGAEGARLRILGYTGGGTRTLSAAANLWAYATPATTSATTYKLRFQVGGANMTAATRNDHSTGQMYAIEVSA